MSDQLDRDDAAGAVLRTRWGRVRFGGRRLSALWVAVCAGSLLAVAIGALAVTTDSAGSRPILGGLVIAFVTLGPCAGLVYALIVDRNTLRDAPKSPEQSVESAWYDKAASGAFGDILLVAGLGTAAVSFTKIDIPASVALASVVLLAMASFAVRYLVHKRRG